MSAVDLAPAKINVCLLLGPIREADGRHELCSVMQALELADRLTLADAPVGASADEVVCPGVTGENLAARALAAFRAATGWDGPPQRLEIIKEVPVAGGMAGGSADAAAALRLVRDRAAADAEGLAAPSDDELRELAATLGADVPAQVRPGRWLATGAGERVAPLAAPAPYGVLVLPGDGPLRTPDVFREADRLGLPRDADGLAAGIAEVTAAALAGPLAAAACVNELAPAARSLRPSIDVALEQALACGADVAMVSGSGPTVLGLFADAAGAERAAAELAPHRPALATRPRSGMLAR